MDLNNLFDEEPVENKGIKEVKTGNPLTDNLFSDDLTEVETQASSKGNIDLNSRPVVNNKQNKQYSTDPRKQALLQELQNRRGTTADSQESIKGIQKQIIERKPELQYILDQPEIPKEAFEEQINEMGPWGAYLYGMGKGVKNIFGELGALEEESPEFQKVEKSLSAGLEEKFPRYTEAGETSGVIAPTMMAGMAIPETWPTAARALIGGLIGLVEGRASVEEEDKTDAGAVGALVGGISEALMPKVLRLGSRLVKELRGKVPKVLFDAAGKPTKELAGVLDEAGMTLDDLVNQAKQLDKPEIKLLDKVIGPGRHTKQLETLAGSVEPDKKVIRAAKELGVEDTLTPSQMTTNENIRAIEHTLKRVDNSKIPSQMNVTNKRIEQEAENLFKEMGARSKGSITDEFARKAEKLTARIDDDLETYSEELSRLMGTGPVETPNTLKHLNNVLEHLKTRSRLTASEEKILADFTQLEGTSKPPVTFEVLDRFKQLLEDRLGGDPAVSEFRNLPKRSIEKLYDAVKADYALAAKNMGPETEKLYGAITNRVEARIKVKKQLDGLLTRNRTGSVINKAETALKSLAEGSNKGFNEFMRDFPKALKSADNIETKEIFATALENTLSGNSKALNPATFDNFMSSLNKNPSSKAKLNRILGKDSVRRLDSMHTVIKSIRKANEVSPARINVQKVLDKDSGFFSKMLGTANTAVKVATYSTVHPAKAIPTIFKSLTNSSSRTEAAEQLWRSDAFRRLIQEQIKGSRSNIALKKNAEKVLKRIPAYNKWLKTLGEDEITALTTYGTIPYLLSEGDTDE